MLIYDCAQGTPAWHAARLGRVTSSRVAEALAMIKRGEAASRANYRTDLIIERITARPTEGYVSPLMLRGIERESDALSWYEARAGVLLDRIGFIALDALMVGCSPDGLVGDDGLVEAKSPIAKTHLQTCTKEQVPPEYLKGVRHSLWVTGRRWCDFISWCPEFPAPLDLWIHRVERDETEIAAHELLVRQFLNEVDAEEERVRALLEG